MCVTFQESDGSEHPAVSGVSMQSLPNAGSPSAHSVHWLSQLSQHSPLHLYLVCRRAPKGRAKDLIIKHIHRELDNETINNAHDGSTCLQPSQDRQECLFARTFLSNCNALHSSYPRAFAALSVIDCCVDALQTT